MKLRNASIRAMLAIALGTIALGGILVSAPGSASAHGGSIPRHEFSINCWSAFENPTLYGLGSVDKYSEAAQYPYYGDQWLYFRIWAAWWDGSDFQYEPGNWVAARNALPWSADSSEVWKEEPTGSGTFLKVQTLGVGRWDSRAFTFTTEIRRITSQVEVPGYGQYWVLAEYRWGSVQGYNGAPSLPGRTHFSEWHQITASDPGWLADPRYGFAACPPYPAYVVIPGSS